MLTAAHRNLTSYLGTGALGRVEHPLQKLTADIATVNRTLIQAVQNEGRALNNHIDNISRSGIDPILPALKDAKRAFEGIECGVRGLHSDAHIVIESARARSRELESQRTILADRIRENKKEQSQIEENIGATKREIDDKEQAANQYDREAEERKRAADISAGVGSAGIVVGVLSAPFTFGLGLVLAAASSATVTVGEVVIRKSSNELREAASNQRQQLRSLESKVDQLRRSQATLETELKTKLREQDSTNSFITRVQSFNGDLNSFEASLSTAVKNINDCQVNLYSMSLRGETAQLLLCGGTSPGWNALPADARREYDAFMNEWRAVKQFFTANKLQ